MGIYAHVGPERPYLRLVRDEAEGLQDAPPREDSALAERIDQMRLVAGQFLDILVSMAQGRILAQNRVDDAPRAVVARIEAKASPIMAAAGDWLEHLKAARRSTETLKSYRSFIMPAIRDMGISSTSELTHDAIIAFMDSRAHAWKSGNTYNRNLAIWRSFTKHLVKRGLLDRDPLELALTVDAEDAQPARAATTEEARTLLAHACTKVRSDKRAGVCTDVYFVTMLLAGCRYSDHGGKQEGPGKGRKGRDREPLPVGGDDEPTGWLWEHLDLAGDVPRILWTSGNNKNRKRQVLALAPQLVEILKAHKIRMEARGYPTGPRDRVFPEKPTPNTWSTYAGQCGIPINDPINGPFKGHSARKWFATTLTNAGVPSKMVDCLMRHTGGVDARYYKPTLEEQRDALACLPQIWPLALNVEKDIRSWKPKGLGANPESQMKKDLTTPPEIAEDHSNQAGTTPLNTAAFDRSSNDAPRAGLVTNRDIGRAPDDVGCVGAWEGFEGLGRLVSSKLQDRNGYSRI